MKSVKIKEFLDEKVLKYNQPFFVETDPIQVPKSFSQNEDIEIAGFITSSIAWGNRVSIIKNAKYCMDLMDNQPFDFITGYSEKELLVFGKFVHRTFNGNDLVYFIRSLKNLYLNHGGLQKVFENYYQQGNSVFSALAGFYTIFFEMPGERTRKHISNVNSGASGKRLNMFLRWMVREDKSGIDFGIWNGIPSSALMLPLDVHTGNVARKLGLLNRNVNDWKAVEEITFRLREFDLQDPVKYDFALFGLGAFEKF